jgi:branched-chain amino acid transport system permease protein
MRFIFKTDYDQDIRLFKHGGQKFWFGLLGVLLLLAPWIVSEYQLAQLAVIAIYAIVGLGLMVLTGYTGLVSLGHAAFLGVGAYTEAILAARGWPFPLSMACAVALSAITGVVVGLPALRVRGIYLAIATLAFGFIVEEIITRWE